MSDIYEEHDACVRLLIDSYSDLKKLDPRHELLSFVEVDGEEFTTKTAFNRRYLKKVKNGGHLGIMNSMVQAMCDYETQLRGAVTNELSLRLERNASLDIGDRAREYLG